jgi:hypothetical protein
LPGKAYKPPGVVHPPFGRNSRKDAKTQTKKNQEKATHFARLLLLALRLGVFA